MRLFVVVATLFCGLLLAFAAVADTGGKERTKSPIFDDEGNIVGTVDPKVDCIEIPAPDQSGRVVYICTPCTEEDE